MHALAIALSEKALGFLVAHDVRGIKPCMDGNTSNCINGPVHLAEIWAWNANGGLMDMALR